MAETLCADSSASSRSRGRSADRATSATRAISARTPGSSERARSRRATKTPWTVSASHAALWRCSWATPNSADRSARLDGERSTRSAPRSRTSTAGERKRTPRRARKERMKGRLWPTMGASPTKARSSGATSPKAGEASTWACVMPVYRWTNGRDVPERVHEGGEAVQDGSALEAHKPNLNDLVRVRVQARRLQVQGHPGLLEQGRAQPRERRRTAAHEGGLGVAGAPPACAGVGGERRDRHGVGVGSGRLALEVAVDGAVGA